MASSSKQSEVAVKAYAIVNDPSSRYVVEQKNALTEPSYQYNPLPSQGDHLRLLKITPGTGARLSCNIEIHPIEAGDRPAFKALSYSWQNPKYDDLIIEGRRIAEKDGLRVKYDVVHPLWCDGKRILISTSLRDALLALRHETEPLWLWVDALCINQDDLQERASQVMLMQRIYHVAAEVCMWLGMEDEFTTTAFEMVKSLQALASQRPSVISSDLYDHRTKERLGLPTFPGRPWEAIVRLLARPYFRRIWILQEMIASGLSARIYCGTSDPITWTALLEAVLFIEYAGWTLPVDSYYGAENHFSYIITVHNLRMAWMQGATSEEDRIKMRRSAVKTRRFEASDPRDKIFALIGIINDFGHRELFGVDRPGGSAHPVVVEGNNVHIVMQVDERGKSKEDIAIEILQKSSDVEIRKLYAALMDYFESNVHIANIFLEPIEDSSSWMESYVCNLEKAADASVLILEFQAKHLNQSRDHQRVGEFAQNCSRMWGRFLMQSNEIIRQYADTPAFVLLCRLPQVRQEMAGFREGNDWMAKSLRVKPDTEGSAEMDDAENDKTPIIVGHLANSGQLEYSVEKQHVYPDWAWSAAGWVVPMYDKPTDQVYAEFTVKCIKDDGNLDILSSVEDRAMRKIGELPSWVPDYSVSMVRGSLASKTMGGNQVYSAGGSEKGSIRWDVSNKDRLGVDGFKVDRIKVLASLESSGNSIIGQFEEWSAMIQTLPEQYPTGGNSAEALWRTIIGNHAKGARDFEYPAPAEYADYYVTFRKLLAFNKDLENTSFDDRPRVYVAHGIDPYDMPRLLAQNNKLTDAMSRVMIERRLFVTEGGLIGAAPVSAKVGDGVYVLKGGNALYVLRESTGRDGFEFVGDCYVHGVMNGEALRREGFKWVEVELR